MNDIDKLYDHYYFNVTISSSGKWCKAIKNKDDKYCHPEPYTKEEFIIKMIYQDQNSSLKSARNRGINWWDEWNIGDNTIGQRYGATVKKWHWFTSF